MGKVFFALAFSVLLVQVRSLDNVLLTKSVLYGIAYLAGENNTLCHQELSALFNATEEKHVWALKGELFSFVFLP